MKDRIRKAVDTVLPDIIKAFELSVEVNVSVENLADEETIEALFIEDPFELLGINSGVASALELHEVDLSQPIDIWLFSDAIEKHLATHQGFLLEAVVSSLLIEEIGSHLRFDERRIQAIQKKYSALKL